MSHAVESVEYGFLRLKPSISVDSLIEPHSYAKEFYASALLRSKGVNFFSLWNNLVAIAMLMLSQTRSS